MHYLGGKSKHRKQIGEHLNLLRRPDQVYWEPFVGSAWVTTEVDKYPLLSLGAGPRLASDIHPELIALWKALQKGWIPPDEVSEEEYKRVRENKNVDPAYYAFVGFGLSWGGKWWGGYARDSADPEVENRSYALSARRSLLAKIKYLQDVHFFVFDFLKYDLPLPSGTLIYCDPPYVDTTSYDAIDKWEPDIFWNKVREYKARGCIVVVSEYRAPDDFKCVREFDAQLTLHPKEGESRERVERLFM